MSAPKMADEPIGAGATSHADPSCRSDHPNRSPNERQSTPGTRPDVAGAGYAGSSRDERLE
jgi:hypothetical protein